MGATGSTTIDFGAFPGKSDTSADVATAGVVAASLIEAWVLPIATADHSVDEHMLETLKVSGRFLSNGNIRIHGFNTSQINEPSPVQHRTQMGAKSGALTPKGTRIYGQWTVAWAWL